MERFTSSNRFFVKSVSSGKSVIQTRFSSSNGFSVSSVKSVSSVIQTKEIDVPVVKIAHEDVGNSALRLQQR